MRLVDFENLAEILKDKLEVMAVRSTRNAAVICHRMQLLCHVRFASGSMVQDLTLLLRIGKSTIYKIIMKVAEAICQNRSLLNIANFPSSVDDCQKICDDFCKECDLFRGTVGCIDGLFIVTKLPSKDEMTGGRKSLYSGNKKHIGINLQAVSNARMQIML